MRAARLALVPAVAGLFAVAWPSDARAVRFSLGLCGGVTPIVLDPDQPTGAPYRMRLGLRPVLDVELHPSFAVETYAPFTVLRVGEGDGAASSGAESVFGLGLSGRYRTVSADKIEQLYYLTARGGFATVTGRAGPYLGVGLGFARTWLDTGRGFFLELDGGRVFVAGKAALGDAADTERWLVGLSAGVVFRLGGERWDL